MMGGLQRLRIVVHAARRACVGTMNAPRFSKTSV